MRYGRPNIRCVHIDVTGLATGIGGRVRAAPLAGEELDIDGCGRHGDVKRRHVVHVE
jgi:hypothetical protein